jgi:tRNA A-37 threonylcarbamoyl transferase component Bud32
MSGGDMSDVGATPVSGSGHGRIFLSYRREDTRHLAGRLYDRLAERFGHAQIFMDVDSIEPGVDFAAAIDAAVASCNVLLALIGPQWLDARNEEGRRRLNDPDDFVVLEVTAALSRDVRVLPVLVDGASPPQAKDLPEALAPLARRNAMRLDHETFRSDLDALLGAVTRIVGRTPTNPRLHTATNMPSTGPRTQTRRSQPSEAAADTAVPAPVRWADRYELGETLDRGGRSELRRALDTHLRRDVMVKTFRTDMARDPRLQLRFRRAVRDATALAHPAIAVVRDAGEVDGDSGPLLYVVMEYVDGLTLRQIVKMQGPMSQQRAVEVMADVCAALDFGHRHDIVHRNVKPANIMISRAGAVKVMDFGIAEALGESQSAAVIGTAHYLSPEQVRGEAVDARSDVYAAGCVLYVLLTGRPPFTGSRTGVAYQHVRENPGRPSALNPSVSPQMDTVVLKALSKNPADRYQSAAEMRADLLRLQSGQQPPAPVALGKGRPAARNPDAPGHTRPVDVSRIATSLPLISPPRPGEYGKGGAPARRRAIGVAAAVLLALVGLTAYLVFGGSPAVGQVVVPDVIGQPSQAARVALEAANLVVSTEGVASTADQKDRVMAANPAANTGVPGGSTVTLLVGAGPESAAVPPLTGRTVAEAGPLLAERGLVLGAQTGLSTADPAQIGKILSSSPAAGEAVPVGTAVAVVVGN